VFFYLFGIQYRLKVTLIYYILFTDFPKIRDVQQNQPQRPSNPIPPPDASTQASSGYTSKTTDVSRSASTNSYKATGAPRSQGLKSTTSFKNGVASRSDEVTSVPDRSVRRVVPKSNNSPAPTAQSTTQDADAAINKAIADLTANLGMLQARERQLNMHQ